MSLDLSQFEQSRLTLSQTLLNSDPSKEILVDSPALSSQLEQILTRSPSVLSAIQYWSKHPRTEDTIKTRLLRLGSSKFRSHAIQESLTTIGCSFLFRALRKKIRHIDVASKLIVILITPLLPDKSKLQRWQDFNQSLYSVQANGYRDRLAGAKFLSWWLMGHEIQKYLYVIDQILQAYSSYIDIQFDLALKDQVAINFPWEGLS